MKVYPHLTIRGVPDAVNWGFEKLEVLRRDTSPDVKVKRRELGKSKVFLTNTMIGHVEPPKVVEVLGGERRIADFASTETNGRSFLVADLLKTARSKRVP
jgi:hypothetical protein